MVGGVQVELRAIVVIKIPKSSAPRLKPDVGWAGDSKLVSVFLGQIIRGKIPVGE
jgi:hypothetical protein